MAPKNIFAIGIDSRNRAMLDAIPGAGDGYNFVELLPYDAIKKGRRRGVYGVDRPLELARDRLKKYKGSVDGMINFWDFPVSMLTTMLAGERDLPAPNLDGLFKCEHKYWSRVIQKQAAPEVVPDFQAVDPFDKDAWKKIELNLPFWIKPVKAFLGQLGFLIRDRRDFRRAMSLTKKRIEHFGKPLNRFMEWLDVPEEIAHVNGNWCIAEEIIGGRQCTLEGWEHGGEIQSHGIVDSFLYPYTSVFFSLEYPSQLPDDVQERMVEYSKTIMKAHGFQGGAFNIEYYWRERTDEIKLLEINPRISQSHAPQFDMVDGAPNHAVLVDLALGKRPEMPHRQGRHKHAGKFMLRRFNDAVVRRVPSAEELEALHKRFPGMFIEPKLQVDDRLSQLAHQDQYSYLLAELFLGGRSPDHCYDVYYRCADALKFDLEYIEEEGAA